MKYLYLIRHAKSSWSDPDLVDFDRPLNKRGRKNGPVMAKRMALRGIKPDIIISSPAKRAKKTARYMSLGTGYKRRDIIYLKELYLGTKSHYLDIIANAFRENDVLFLVGHNHIITDLADYLTGECFVNVPTCGIVGMKFPGKIGFNKRAKSGIFVFFDYPKKVVGKI